MAFLNRIRSQYENRIHFVFIYISEAHADDEWPRQTEWRIKQPKSSEERLGVVRQFLDKTQFTWDIYVDPILVTDGGNEDEDDDGSREEKAADAGDDRSFEDVYAPWPTRGFVMSTGGKIEFIMQPKIETDESTGEFAFGIFDMWDLVPVALKFAGVGVESENGGGSEDGGEDEAKV